MCTTGKPSKPGKPRHIDLKCWINIYIYIIGKPCKPSKPVNISSRILTQNKLKIGNNGFDPISSFHHCWAFTWLQI